MKMERKYSHIVTFLNKVCCYHLQDDKESNVCLALDVYSVDSKTSTLLQMKELFCHHPITKRDADCKEVTIIHTSMQYHNGLGCCVPITVILKYYSKKNILFLYTTQIQQDKLILSPLGKLDCCCNVSSFCISAGPSLAFLEERQLVLVLPFFKTKKHITLPVTNTDKILYFQNDENFTSAECILSSTNRLFRMNLDELSFDSTEIFLPYYIGKNTFVNLEKVQNNIEVIINSSEGRLLNFCNGSMVNLSRATFSDVESISFLKYSTFCYLVLCTLHHKVYLLNRETLQIERSWQHVWLTVFSENGRQKLLLIPLSGEQNKIILIDTQDLINEKNLTGKSLNFQNSINHHSALDALLFRMKESKVMLDKVFSEVERKKNFTMGLINRLHCFSKTQDFSELSQDKLVSVLPSSKHHNHQENQNSLDLVDLWQKIYGKTWSIVVIVKNVTTKPIYNITLSLSTSKTISYETKWIIEDMKEYYGEENTLGSSSSRCLLSGSAVVLGLLVRTKPAMNQCINYSNCYLTVSFSFTSDESESNGNIDESLSSFKTHQLIQMLIGKITLNAKDIIDDRPSFLTSEGLITKFHKQIKSRQVMYKGVNVEDFKDKISLILTTDQQNLLFKCFDKKSLTTECLLRNYLGATLLSNIQFFSWKNNCLQFNDNVWLEICGSAHLSSGTVTIHYRSKSDLIILYHYLYKHLPSFILMEAERRHFHLKRGLSQELHYIKKLLDISSDNAENLSEYLDKLQEEHNAKRLKFFHSADIIVSSSQYKKHLAMLFQRQTETDKFVSTRNK